MPLFDKDWDDSLPHHTLYNVYTVATLIIQQHTALNKYTTSGCTITNSETASLSGIAYGRITQIVRHRVQELPSRATQKYIYMCLFIYMYIICSYSLIIDTPIMMSDQESNCPTVIVLTILFSYVQAMLQKLPQMNMVLLQQPLTMGQKMKKMMKKLSHLFFRHYLVNNLQEDLLLSEIYMFQEYIA